MIRYIIVLLFAVLFVLPENVSAQTAQTVLDPNDRTDSLKLLSWNIYMLPPVIKVTGKRKRARAIGEKLVNSDYDILVLQEAFHAGARRMIKHRLKDKYPYENGPAFRKFFSLKTSSGIWMLSKYPIKELGKIRFRQKAGFDNKMARKGALMIEMDKDGQKFHIVGTHLNAGGSLDIRASQVRQIKNELIDVYHTPGTPLIVAGDFNISKFDPNGLDSMLTILEMEDYELDGDQKYTFDFTLNDLGDGKSKGVIDYVYFKPEKLKMKTTSRRIPLIEKIWSKKRKSLADHNPVELLLYYKP